MKLNTLASLEEKKREKIKLKLLLLSGKARFGKSTSALIIKRHLEKQGYKCCIMPFARYIKMLHKEYLGWDGVTKNNFWRSSLVNMGEEDIKKRMKKPFFHVNRTCEDIDILRNSFEYFIIDDCRLKREVFYADAYYPEQVTTMRVERLNFESDLSEENKKSPTETDLDSFKYFDYTITSDNGLDNLEQAILESGIIEDIIKE